MSERMFPMQDGPPIPWATAEVVYSAYANLFGKRQSLERLAESGGFGWREVAHIFDDLRRDNPELHSKLTNTR